MTSSGTSSESSAVVSGSPGPRPAGSSPASRLIALFLVSAGLLQAQIALTKVFSVVLWYHFGFLVISLAMLGFAAAGAWLARRPEALDRAPALFARSSGMAALWLIIGMWIVAHTDFDAQHLIAQRNEGPLLALIGFLIVPFFFMGRAVSAVLTYHRDSASSVYSANLLGSGAGCALAVLLFDGLHLSASDVVISSAGLVAFGGLLFSLKAGLVAWMTPMLSLAVVVGLWLCPDRESFFHLDAPPSKPLHFVEDWMTKHNLKRTVTATGEEIVYYGPEGFEDGDFLLTTPYDEVVRVPAEEAARDADGGFVQPEPADLIEYRRWTSLSRVDAFTWPKTNPSWGLWGLSSTWAGEFPNQKGITIDTWAMTNVMEWDRTPDATGEVPLPPEILEYLPATLVHRVRPDSRVLCIGAGGGMDLLAAKRFEQPFVRGVEINPSVVDAVRSRFLDFQGGLYDPQDESNGVEIVVSEGRHFLERDEDRYDIVQLSGVDTASTTQAGAFALSENFLYTEEAFDTYLEHTTEDGLVTLTRWVLPDPETGKPRNSLRLFVLAWEALERLGIENPADHIYQVASNNQFSVILFGRQPLSDGDIATLDAACERFAYDTLFHPRRPSPWIPAGFEEPAQNEWEAFAQTSDRAAYLAEYPYDVSAPTDNRPFFFETSKFGPDFLKRSSLLSPLGGPTSHAIVAALLLLLSVLSIWLIFAPLARGGTGNDRVARRPMVFLFFLCLGLGFIFVEVVLAQQFVLFLGNPVYSLAVVLFSVLIFSGLGAAFSSRLAGPSLPLTLVVIMAAGYPFVLESIFEVGLQLPNVGRIAVSVLLLAPLAFVMGMPFALGLRRIASADARVSAWAWGINGYASVVGSVVTVILSMTLGFRMVVWIGAGTYLVALLVAPLLARRIREDNPADEKPDDADGFSGLDPVLSLIHI